MSDDADDDMPAIETNAGGDRERFNPAELGGADAPRVTKGRVYSETTRAAFKQAAEKLKAQIDDGAEADDLEPAITTEPDAKDAKSATAATPATEQQTQAQAQQPVHSAVDAIAAERMAQLEAKEKALAEREAQLRDHRGRFKEDAVMTIKDMVREAHGLDEKADIKPYAMDLITELSGELLGLDVPESVKARQERKKAERILREHNQSQTKFQEAQKADEAKRIEADQRRSVVGNIKLELTKPEHSTKYPWLLASTHDGDPADIVYGVAEAIIKRDPSWKPELHDAAKRANDFYEKKAKQHYEQYKHLLTPTPPKPQAATAVPPQERPPGSRSRETLTNTQATEAPSRTSNPARPMTNDERRRLSLKKFAATIPTSD